MSSKYFVSPGKGPWWGLNDKSRASGADDFNKTAKAKPSHRTFLRGVGQSRSNNIAGLGSHAKPDSAFVRVEYANTYDVFQRTEIITLGVFYVVFVPPSLPNHPQNEIADLR